MMMVPFSFDVMYVTDEEMEEIPESDDEGDVVAESDEEIEEILESDEEIKVVAESDDEGEVVAESDEEGEEGLESEEEVEEPVDKSIEGQLPAAAETISANWNPADIEEAMTNLYDTVDGIVMVYVITPKGIIEAVYPDEYNAAIGDFIGRLPVGGVLLKAREFTQTDEYTSPREKITGYDVIHPIFSNDDEYLGAIVAKFSSK